MYQNNYYEDELHNEIENAFLTPAEVQNLLFIGRNTFYSLVNSGKLQAFRVGKQWRVRREDLIAFCSAK